MLLLQVVVKLDVVFAAIREHQHQMLRGDLSGDQIRPDQVFSVIDYGSEESHTHIGTEF